MALSAADRASLSQEQQDAIRSYTEQYSAAKAAGDASAMAAAHQAAEKVRATAGYSGGAGGTEKKIITPAASGVGEYANQRDPNPTVRPTKTSQQMADYIDQYMAQNYNAERGYVNGYSGAMNGRLMANAIRQQMLENTQNWWNAGDQATKDYLHQQNVELNDLLTKTTGGAQSSYDAKSGEWTTQNGNLGYGRIVSTAPGDLKNYYGYTDADIKKYKSDFGRYFNFADKELVDKAVDASSGYTGKYASGGEGPNPSLLYGGSLAYGQGGAEFSRKYYGNAGTLELMSADAKDKDAVAAALRAGGGDAYRASADQSQAALTPTGDGYLAHAENGVIQSGWGTDANQAKSWHKPLNEQGAGGGASAGGASGGGASAGGADAGGASEGALADWRADASQQAENAVDFSTNQAVRELQRAQEDAEAAYRTQRSQISADERRGLDNSALYAELRGDRGGIGQEQYNEIQNTAAVNRQTVNAEQTRLAADTQRQIADLRAQGEYEKADKLLSISQSYLQQLVSLEKWAAEYRLSAAKFQQSVYEWQQEYAYKVGQLLGSYNGRATYAAEQDSLSALAQAGKTLLSAGLMPSAAQLQALGLTQQQASQLLAAGG